MDLLRLLLEKGAKTNVSIDNHSALHVAGFVNSVEALNVSPLLVLIRGHSILHTIQLCILLGHMFTNHSQLKLKKDS